MLNSIDYHYQKTSPTEALQKVYQAAKQRVVLMLELLEE